MLEGEISQINLIERLVELWREQFTGAIRFENDGIIKIVYFKSGDILSASTNDRSDSIDEILMRAGKVSREHVKQALAKRKENETLGDALLNLGFITRKELTWARRVQVVGVIRSIAAWTEGSFTIVADYLPKRDEGTLFPLPQVLVELIVTEQDRGRFERALDGGNAVFTKTADFDDVWRKLGLNEDADAIVVEIDGTKSATDVATASGRDTFNVYKLLDALATLGVLKRASKAQKEPQFALDDFASAGVADAADLWNEPAPTAAFDLDEAEAAAQPTLEVPRMTLEAEPEPYAVADDAALPVLPAPSAWDETEEMSFEDETPSEAPPPIPMMPGWNIPVRESLAVPIPAPIEPPAEPAEEQWGFDEAQLETARRASMPIEPPAPAKPARPERRYGLIVTLLILAILAAAGYFGFRWWQGQQATEPLVVEHRPVTKPVRPVTAAPATDTGTIVETTSTSTTTTAPVVPPTATATATPMQVTAEPAKTAAEPAPAPTPTPIKITPEPPPTQALPRVTAKTTTTTAVVPPVAPGRERYDGMARDFAANNTARFTVQIQILCDPSNLDKAMRSGGANVWFVPQQLGSRSCYRVYWGRFNTRDEAQRALGSVPAGLRDQNAAVKALAP